MVDVRRRSDIATIMGAQTRIPHTTARDKATLRAMVIESVNEFTVLRREQIWAKLTGEHSDWPQEQVQAAVDEIQPLYDDYDPVVQMAVTSVDHRHSAEVRLRAMVESAQYLRPKLKSIELRIDPASEEEVARRNELADMLIDRLDLIAARKRERVVEGSARTVSPAREPAQDISRSGSSSGEVIPESSSPGAPESSSPVGEVIPESPAVIPESSLPRGPWTSIDGEDLE